MARVWSHCTGLEGSPNRSLASFREFSGGNVGGWTHCTNFERLVELVDYLDDEGLAGSVQWLAINSHGSGDGGGDINLESVLSPATFSGFAATIRGLRAFFSSSGPKLLFTGCSTGMGDEGTELMRLISAELPDITIIAFEMTSVQRTWGGSQPAAGQIDIDPASSTRGTYYRTKSSLVGPYHPAAKWVLNGVVLKYGAREQSTRPAQRCGYPPCPGHADPQDQCDGTWHTGCEWRGREATVLAPEYSHFHPGWSAPDFPAGGLRPYYPTGRETPQPPASSVGRSRRPSSLGTRPPRRR